jgi:ABC-type transporter Mla subunit MlaD
VQDQLNRILSKNRTNIDATISNLSSVTGTLLANRAGLERTLCSLPAGLAPYYETSSWGQWFNVRVTTVTFKDNHGQLISHAGELPNARGTGSGPVYTCGGAPDLQKHPKAASPVLSDGGLSAFLDFVTARRAA